MMNELSNSHVNAESFGGEADTVQTGAQSDAKLRDWRKSMSDHVAYALLVYTGLQIFMTVKALAAGMSSILPYVALIILVAAIIPACRWFERRWTGMSDEEAVDESFAGAFRRDTIMLWTLAIGLPLLLTGLCKAVFAVM